jgi:peptidyl-prolyl cis-trans isomerase SurA
VIEQEMKQPAISIVSLCIAMTVTEIGMAQTRELGSSGELLDGVAALVDSGVVLKSELQSRVGIVRENFTQQQAQLPPEQRGQLPPLSVLEQQVLDQLILEEIQIQRASRIGVEIGDDQLNSILAEIAQSAGQTLEQFPTWLEAQGFSYPQFREDQELEQCLEMSQMSENSEFDYNTSHILIGFDPDGPQDQIVAAEERIRDIARQLDEGADFAQLAVAYSESQTALEGGNLGWRKGSELPTIFAADVTEMEPGAHSAPIRGGGGFHIVRLNELRGVELELVDQIRPRHILLTPTEVLDDDATRQRLQGVRDQILAGDDFATVASALSEDVASAVDGGDLGWLILDRAGFVPEFSEVLKSLEVGELSQPFRTDFGWHIAEITDQRVYDMTDDLRDANCRNQIGRGKAVEESELWRRRLQAEAYIVKKI